MAGRVTTAGRRAWPVRQIFSPICPTLDGGWAVGRHRSSPLSRWDGRVRFSFLYGHAQGYRRRHRDALPPDDGRAIESVPVCWAQGSVKHPVDVRWRLCAAGCDVA